MNKFAVFFNLIFVFFVLFFFSNQEYYCLSNYIHVVWFFLSFWFSYPKNTGDITQ